MRLPKYCVAMAEAVAPAAEVVDGSDGGAVGDAFEGRGGALGKRGEGEE